MRKKSGTIAKKEVKQSMSYRKKFIPYALAAFLIGLVGGFSSVLGPAFVQDLSIPYHNTTWTALAQAISTAACAPTLGKLGDRIGRKMTLLLGTLVFTIGNVLTAMSTSLALMLISRFIVGIGTAAMSPMILAFIVTEFPKTRVAVGFSLYMLISSASVIFGPILGSLIVSQFGWRVMIWVCTAICLIVFAAQILIGEKNRFLRNSAVLFDIPGAVLVLLFFGSLLCIPSFGQNIGWTSSAFFVALLLSVGSVIGLVFEQRKSPDPILSIKILKSNSFFLAVLILFLTQGLMQANMTSTIIFVNHTRPQDAMISGYAISVMYLGMSLGAAFLGPLADRCDPKTVLLPSLVLTLLGCFVMCLYTKNTSAPILMASLGTLGFGLGGNGTILMKVALSDVGASAATGTGTYGLFRDLAAPFGVAVFVPFFTNRLTAIIQSGIGDSDAAVRAIHDLGFAEIACVLGGIAVTFFLPKMNKKGEKHET